MKKGVSHSRYDDPTRPQGGWVRLYRCLFDDLMFDNETKTEREAWLWLLSNAAWRPTNYRIGNRIVQVERGSQIVALRYLQLEWSWKSEKRVRGFLDRLREGRKIDLSLVAGKTQITICNYDAFSGSDEKMDARRTDQGANVDRTKEESNKEERESVTATDLDDSSVHAGGDPSPSTQTRTVYKLIAEKLGESAARSTMNKWRRDHTDKSISAAANRAVRSGAEDLVCAIESDLAKGKAPAFDGLVELDPSDFRARE